MSGCGTGELSGTFPPKQCSPNPSRVAKSKLTSMSEHASLTGGTRGELSCTSDWASWETSNPTLRPSASKAPVTGRTTSACGGRGHERVEVDMEVERLQCIPASSTVAVGHEQVRSEAHEPSRPGRATLERRRVEVLSGYEPKAAGTSGRASMPIAFARFAGSTSSVPEIEFVGTGVSSTFPRGRRSSRSVPYRGDQRTWVVGGHQGQSLPNVRPRHGGQDPPCRAAYATASARLRTPSLRSTLLTWCEAVLRLM